MAGSETRRARVETCTIVGVEAVFVFVEIELSTGLPGMQIVGMGDTAVQEARQRVKSAVRAAGFEMRADRHVVVNLAPASLRKTGSGFDLPIALAYLVASGQLPARSVEGMLVIGELSLEGAVSCVHGLFAHALAARDGNLTLLSGMPEQALPHLDGLRYRAIRHLSDLKDAGPQKPHTSVKLVRPKSLDYADVVGQDVAVRALQIAAAGGHGLLMVGPPGSGKSMLARRLPSILPPLDEEECIESAVIHSVAGLDVSSIATGVRPFRSPHHSASVASLVGGGQPVMPGEATLAHNGVLFLDELGEFGPSVLQALRQPLEDGEVTICRAGARLRFPARFQLLAASNPCPCGFLGDADHECSCTGAQLDRYKSKLGGPIKDRIDLVCEVGRVDPSHVLASGKGRSSEELLGQVLEARERASARLNTTRRIVITTPAATMESCGLDNDSRSLVEKVARRHGLSGRGIVRVLRVARTIADLEASPAVKSDHLLEAFMFRVENSLG